MAEPLNVDICVIGAGAGGLSVAAGAAMLGASTVLIEKGVMGGDCLNRGCVPSKALLAAAHAAQGVRRAPDFGVDGAQPVVDAARLYGHVRATIDAIAPNDSVERFEGFGTTVIQAQARFTGPRRIAAGGRRIDARRVVVATGSVPRVPPIPGLEASPYLTNETIFGLEALPRHLVIIGGGPIGVEMAQAHRRLGARVTVLEQFTLLARDDPELVDVVRSRLLAEGVVIREGVRVVRVEASDRGIDAVLETDGGETRVQGSHLLVAVGRRPTVDGLDLEAGRIDYTDAGIRVDARLRTSERKTFAVGDVTGGAPFTHVASHHASVVVKNALFRIPARVETRTVPWVTYTAPELAQVGLGEAEARSRGIELRILRWPFAENDRAIAERRTEGLIKVVTTTRGRILGAGIVGAQAGDLIQVWALALARRLKVGAMASLIVPYPTLGEVGKRAAGSFFTPTLFGGRSKALVRFLGRFG